MNGESSQPFLYIMTKTRGPGKLSFHHIYCNKHRDDSTKFPWEHNSMCAEWYSVRKPSRPLASLSIPEKIVAKATGCQSAEQTSCLLWPADPHSELQCFGSSQDRPVRKILLGVVCNMNAE